jgi:hypothetical protein
MPFILSPHELPVAIVAGWFDRLAALLSAGLVILFVVGLGQEGRSSCFLSIGMGAL